MNHPFNAHQAQANMTSVILLIQSKNSEGLARFEDSNYLRFAKQLSSQGCSVQLCLLATISMAGSKIQAQGFRFDPSLKVGMPYPQASTINLGQADLVWILSLGMRDSFLDTIQLLHCLETETRVINSTHAIMHLKSKYFLASHPETFRYAESFASCDANYLFDIIESRGGSWIAKPPAGSLGRQVFKLEAKDPNCKVILETLTGADQNQFCLLQPYIEAIAQGEKRVLFAAGQVVGQYLRVSGPDHRTNISAGALYQPCDLSSAEMSYCQKIGQFLLQQGACFVGLDLAFPYVIEFNVINPGGLLTIDSIGGGDLSKQVIDKIFAEYL